MKEVLNQLISNKIYPEDKFFYKKVCALLFPKNKYKKGLENILLNSKNYISNLFDSSGVQNSCSYRNCRIARQLAYEVIDDEGKININNIDKAMNILKENIYSLGYDAVSDIPRREHILNVLKLIREKKEFQQILMQISHPLPNSLSESIIRDTLNLSNNEIVDDTATRRAAVSAWLTFLRQSIGSCFATAPAIMIQNEQPLRMLNDFNDFISKGFVTRIVNGDEYTIPLSSTWGMGDLRKTILLQKTEIDIKSSILKAPGLVKAFEAAGLIDKEDDFLNKHKCSIEIIKKALQKYFNNKIGFYFITPENVIKCALQEKWNVSDEQVNSYQLSIKNNTSIFYVQTQIQDKDINNRCKNYCASYEAAKRAFIALTDNALLKSWEFSLASMCDTKTDFSRWNLYSSLGFDEQYIGGIGACIYEKIKEKLESANREARECHENYDTLYSQVKYLEARVKSVGSESELQLVRLDYQRKVTEMNRHAALRDQYHHKAKIFADLFDYLKDIFLVHFTQFFQEVYDADMQDINVEAYDDSPAGFRLLCKYGRRDSSAWTLIYNENQFIDALSAFFVYVEYYVLEEPALEGFEVDVGEIITAIVDHIKTREFLETAFHRMALAHGVQPIKDPLDNMDKVSKKPWVYTSGGTVKTLLGCYYSLGDEIEEDSRWVESPTELLVYLLNIIKYMPAEISQRYMKNYNESLLMHSPTHAFILKPGYSMFCKGWCDEGYTYTWVRDNIIQPYLDAVRMIMLDKSMMLRLLDIIAEELQLEHHKEFFKACAVLPMVLSVKDFRNYILKDIEDSPLISRLINADIVDSVLYSALPLTEGSKLKDTVIDILAEIQDVDIEKIQFIYNETSFFSKKLEYYSADEVQDLCKGLLMLYSEKEYDKKEYSHIINTSAIKNKAALPMPIIFADSNWIKSYFAFCVNPGTEEFELWHFDYIGRRGQPISNWKHWLDGTHQKPKWGVYNNPKQYGSTFNIYSI